MGENISKASIRKAGERLKNKSFTKDDLNLLSQYRTSHIPLMKMLVKTIKDKLPKPQIVARRLKRLNSIIYKLERFNSMKLDRMQDIGGVRAIFRNNDEVFKFAKNIEKIYSSKKTTFVIKRVNNYIDEPKQDGYTSYHIVFEYVGKIDELRGYSVELQLRDTISHSWATAVEVLALGTSINLKVGVGDEYYKRFFYLSSKLLMGDKSVKDELKDLEQTYNILKLLRGLSVVTENIKDKKTKGFYLIMLNYETRMLKFISFKENELNTAGEIYQSMETSDKMDSVLVSVSDVKNLKKAYPNYFLDANLFINEIEKRIKNE